MARILLIVPHLPQRLASPYLGQQYLASSLLRAGHEVSCLDMAATGYLGDEQDALCTASDYDPDLIGMTLFTYNAARGYALAELMSPHAKLLVAGGPHPTVCPTESLQHSFDVVVTGEAEERIVQLADALDRGEPVPSAPGIWQNQRPGSAHTTLDNLDRLPFPLESRGCYSPELYGSGGSAVTMGMITSRGCPAKCTFCSNAVTGRRFRWRSASNVVSEMLALRAKHGMLHFSFWDDAFTSNRPRLEELCKTILDTQDLAGTTWSCITPGNMVAPRDLALMRRAGCIAINFGLESGDLQVLKAIKKGQRPEQVKAAVAAAKSEGMTTVVNFMFGFPDEGPDELGRTLALMQDLSNDVDVFNNRGVLVPFPGTAIYEKWHAKYGFTDWWLRPDHIVDEPPLHHLDANEAFRQLETDPTLDLDFFRYDEEVRNLIEECVRFKARHNMARIKAMGGELET